MRKYPIFGERVCTYCGNTMFYITEDDGSPIGVCDCGNIDYCDNETMEDVQKRFGTRLTPSKLDFLYTD